jgi:superoxide dismutase, Cu-Zn family
MKPLLGLVLLAAVAACASAAPKAHAVAKMIGLDGKPMGRAVFQATSHGVLIEIELHGLTPGAHAVMIHTTASCDPKTQFTSAGPDFSFAAPDAAPKLHGYFAKGGPRPGDLPNQFAGADGVLHASMVTTAFTLGNGKKSAFDRDGASIIVNERGDDYLTQPDGNAGRRVACGTIIRTSGPGARKAATQHKHK